MIFKNVHNEIICHTKTHKRKKNTTNYIIKIIYLYKNDTIIKALEVLHENKISTLPIIDEETNNLFGLFYLKDIIFLFNNDEKFTVNNCY